MREAIEDFKATLAPLAETGPDRVTVQAACAPQTIVDGEQLTPVTATIGCKATVAVDVAAPNEIVMVAL